nr:unnamed protein product [Callosobruchus chinensis]
MLEKEKISFGDNMPGTDWFKSFMQRSRDLVVRLAVHTKRVRVAVSYERVDRSLEGVSPSNVVNYDETNFTDDPGALKVVVRRQSKHAHSYGSIKNQHKPVAGACVVYKAKHMYEG